MHDTQDEHQKQLNRLNDQLRQLILMRETGPKSAMWHQARTSMIWRLHREIEQHVQAIEQMKDTTITHRSFRDKDGKGKQK